MEGLLSTGPTPSILYLICTGLTKLRHKDLGPMVWDITNSKHAVVLKSSFLRNKFKTLVFPTNGISYKVINVFLGKHFTEIHNIKMGIVP